jgi:glucoamylase
MAMDLLHLTFLSSLIPFSNFTLLPSPVIYPAIVMYSFTSLLMVGNLALHAVLGFPDPSRVIKQREAELLKRSVDSFIATESPIALADLLCNIGSAGACASGADSGIVVASPDKTNPDCTAPMISFHSAC